METNGALKTKNAERVFSAAIAVVLPLTLSLWGAAAMLAGSVVGLAAYIFIFKERLRGRGSLTAAISVAASAALAAAVVSAVSLIGPH